MESPFEKLGYNGGSETLTSAITAKQPVDLVIALLSLSVFFGIDRVDKAIKATYLREQSDAIISGMNATLQYATS